MRARYQSAPYDGTGKVDRWIKVSGTTESSIPPHIPDGGCGAFFHPSLL